MNQRQLANVLIKILGLSMCPHAVPSIVTGVLTAIQFMDNHKGARSTFWIYPLISLISVAIGVYLIARSRKIVQVLFKGEGE